LKLDDADYDVLIGASPASRGCGLKLRRVSATLDLEPVARFTRVRIETLAGFVAEDDGAGRPLHAGAD